MLYKIKYKKNLNQIDFHNDDLTQFLHLSSGFGGGKSFALCQKIIKLSNLNKPYPGGLMGPSYTDLKRDVIEIMDSILESNQIPFQYHKTEHWYKFPWTPARLYLFSAEKKLRGPNLGYLGINEASLISHERYLEAVGRVRIKHAQFPQIVSVGTPEGIGNYIYEIFIENPMDGSRIIYGDTRNNIENLSKSYIKNLENSYDQITLDAYLKGLWINMNANRFYYAYEPSRNDDKNIEQISGLPILVSLDFNVSPMCATLWQQIKSQNGQTELHAFDQIEIKDGADTHKMCRALYEYGLDPINTYIYPDPAGRARSTKGPPDIEILKQEGWENIKVKLVAPQFRKRQLAVNNLLEKAVIKINPLRCIGIKKDFESVCFDEATYEKLKDNPKLTHFSDGLDYLVDIEYPLSGEKPQSGMQRIR